MSIEFHEVPRYQQLARIIRDQIDSGEILPHHPIPSKATLKARHNVAGTTVDRAIQVLKDEGRIITVPGLGLYVTERKNWR